MSLPPPRRERFSDPVLDAVWAAAQELEPGLLFELQHELAARLSMVDLPTSVTKTKRLAAVKAIRSAAEVLGHSPSITEYRQLRADRPELQLPPDGSVRNWLGLSRWNECLRDAKLDTSPEGDVVVMSLGPAFTHEEVRTALGECVADLGYVPGLHTYLAWSRRPDVRRRPGRRPRSQPVFDRLYGGWMNALRAGGFIVGEGALDAPDSTIVRAGHYFQTDDEIKAGLCEVAARLGRPPRTTEYPNVRRQILEESRAAGDIRTIPSVGTIQRRFETWDSALVFSGLDPFGGRGTFSNPPAHGCRRRRYTEDDMLAAIRQAYEAVGNPFTVAAYSAWREKELLRARIERRFIRLPHYFVIWKKFGIWPDAVRRALDSTTSNKAA